MQIFHLVVLTLLNTMSCLCIVREEISFNFGWRFYLGHIQGYCDASAFPHNLTGMQCMGLLNHMDAPGPNDCRVACCLSPMCAIWLFSKDDGCWVGQSDDCNHPNPAWIGGGKDVPATLPSTGPASKEFDDSSWELVDTPHDGLITGDYTNESAIMFHGYIPTNITWYRKHFNLPSEWNGRSIWIYFEGVFRASTTFFNGQPLLYHDSGYTSFSVRLDNASNVFYGDGKENENLLTVVANPGYQYSGWWYEGGGIYRNVKLVSTSPVHIIVNSVYGPAMVTGAISDHDPNDRSKGQYAADVDFYPLAEITNERTVQASVMVRFDIIDGDNNSIKGTVTSPKVAIDPGKAVLVNTTIPNVTNVELWNIVRTYLYNLNVSVIDASDQSLLDSITVSVGVRQTKWDPQTGFYLNGKHFKWRGFNNHNHFSGVGVAVPDRINLFRAQMMRAAGANAWRMSHNPPLPMMLDILDHVGIVVWDENREFGENLLWTQNQRDMVRRDRNHPSVMIWSFCNEVECTNGNSNNAPVEFTAASKEEDPFRPVSANMESRDTGKNFSKVIDVQGFSHSQGGIFDQYHQQFPQQPLIGSECCSCNTQRGEDAPDKSSLIYSNFNADCNKQQTEWQLNRGFVVGCMVWTLFDYYGPDADHNWPMVTTAFGSIDLAGFAKASAYWYRTWWYYSAKSNTSYTGYDVPFNPSPLVDPYAPSSKENPTDGYIVHIVQKWEPLPNIENRTIHVYTNAPMAELYVNGKSQGTMKVDWQGWAEWSGISFSPGNITATALDSQSNIKATHTTETTGAPTKVVTVVDVPSTLTGTGEALVLDGQDAGMVSAAIVDAQGRVVPSATNNITFSIVSGPGRITGVGNGDPFCHEPNKALWRSAYHGLARAVIQVTKNAASSTKERRRLRQIDREGGIHTTVMHPEATSPKTDAIVVMASAKGLESSTVSIAVSTDLERNGVLAIAKRSMNRSYNYAHKNYYYL